MYHLIADIMHAFKADDYIDKYYEYLGKVRKYIDVGELDLQALHAKIESKVEVPNKPGKSVKQRTDLDLKDVEFYDVNNFGDTFWYVVGMAILQFCITCVYIIHLRV